MTCKGKDTVVVKCRNIIIQREQNELNHTVILTKKCSRRNFKMIYIKYIIVIIALNYSLNK